MNDIEKNLICKALATDDPARINAVCRDILTKRLQWDKQPDRKLRFLLEDVVKVISFPLSYSVSETVVEMPNRPNEIYSTVKVTIYAVIALIGIGICFTEIQFISILGAIVSSMGGYGIGRCMASKPSAPVMKKSEVRVTTTSKTLEQEVDSIYGALTRFYKYRQLDGRNIRILTWMQHFYADGASQKEKDGIERLLALYGYTFRNFAEDNSADFEAFTGNVSAPTTTEPAIYNEDNVAVCKGTVVIPSVD